MSKQIGYLQASVRFRWLVIDQVLFCVFMDREEEVNKNGAQYLAILTEQFFRDQRGKSRRAGNRPILSTRVANQNTSFALSYFFSLCYFFLYRSCFSKFTELQFADIVSSAIPLFPEEQSDWAAFESKRERVE